MNRFNNHHLRNTILFILILTTTSLLVTDHVTSLDLSQTQSVRPGGKFPITNQELIQELSNFYAANSALSTQICSVLRVVNPTQQIVAGTLYFMTVQLSVIKSGSGFTTAQCGTINPENLIIVCQEVKIFKPLNSNTFVLKNETVVACPL